MLITHLAWLGASALSRWPANFQTENHPKKQRKIFPLAHLSTLESQHSSPHFLKNHLRFRFFRERKAVKSCKYLRVPWCTTMLPIYILDHFSRLSDFLCLVWCGMVLPTNLCESTLSMFRVASHFSDRSCTRVAISSFCPTRESCRKFAPCKWMQSKTCMKESRGSPPKKDLYHVVKLSTAHLLHHHLLHSNFCIFWKGFEMSEIFGLFLEFAFHSHPSLSFHLHIITWISQLRQYPEVAISFESKKPLETCDPFIVFLVPDLRLQK